MSVRYTMLMISLSEKYLSFTFCLWLKKGRNEAGLLLIPKNHMTQFSSVICHVKLSGKPLQDIGKQQ